MIKKESQQDKEELTHRRRGGAFDDFARVLRKVNKLIFNTGTTLNDRPGVREAGGKITKFVSSDSVFEIFQKEPRSGTFNFITIGKKANSEKFNTNYIDLSANARSDESSPGNGAVGLKLTRDGVWYNNAKISLYEAGNYLDQGMLGPGARVEITGEGLGGGVQLTYFNPDGTILGFVLDADGIQFYGLPTSAPSGSNKLYTYDNGTRKYICIT